MMFPGLPRPLLFAHRGASAHAPENTLEAFELGARLGADVLELDVHLTRDGEVVVLHDARVERTTNGAGEVRAMSYAELAQLDAGARYLSPARERVFAGRGVYVPRLVEVLSAFPRSGFNIELKQREPSMVAPTLRLLARLQPERVLLTAADDRVMAELEAAKPSYPLGLAHRQVRRVVMAAHLGRCVEGFRGRALQIPPRSGLLPVCTPRVVRQAHAAGMEVHLWTVNSPTAAARWLARCAVDGIMSDDPGALAGVCRDNRRVPT